MNKSFNKGEWSEFYAFLKIILDKKLYAADNNLNKIENIFHPVIKIIRIENKKVKIYDISVMILFPCFIMINCLPRKYHMT